METVKELTWPKASKCFNKASEQAEVILEQKRTQEEEIWNILEQHVESWEPAEKIEAVADKATKAVTHKQRVWDKTGTIS